MPPRPGKFPVGSSPTLTLCCRCCCWSHNLRLSELGQTLGGKDSISVTCTKSRGFSGPTPRLAPSLGSQMPGLRRAISHQCCWAAPRPPLFGASRLTQPRKAPPTSRPGEARRKPHLLLPPVSARGGVAVFQAIKGRSFAHDLVH